MRVFLKVSEGPNWTARARRSAGDLNGSKDERTHRRNFTNDASRDLGLAPDTDGGEAAAVQPRNELVLSECRLLFFDDVTLVLEQLDGRGVDVLEEQDLGGSLADGERSESLALLRKHARGGAFAHAGEAVALRGAEGGEGGRRGGVDGTGGGEGRGTRCDTLDLDRVDRDAGATRGAGGHDLFGA